MGTCTTTNAQKCAAADTGSSKSQQTCIFTCCAVTYCSEGAGTYYTAIEACVCTASTCKSACSDSGDYCGGGAPNVTTQNCDDCLTQYLGSGLQCDPTTGAIAAACSADPGCTAYEACTSGCP